MKFFGFNPSLHWELGIGILEDNVFGKETLTASHSLEERRRDPRVSLSLPISYRPKGKRFRWLHAHSLDVSRNGVRLSLSHPVAVGSEMELFIKLPGMSKKVRVEGVVVWAKQSHNDPSTIQCGIAFKSLRRLSNREKIMHFMADKICSMAEQHIGGLVCRPARSFEDIKRAYALVYREYVARGYCEPNPTAMHYSPYALFPYARTFLLERGDNLLGTISLISDSPCGLPLETLFPAEVKHCRRPGHRIAEVGLLALSGESFRKKSFTLTDFQKLTGSFRLFKIMFDYARFMLGTTDLVIAMHPKHKELYEYLSFRSIGPVRSYPGACGKPALLMHMNIQASIHRVSLARGAGFYFLRTPTSLEVLGDDYELSTADVEELLLNERRMWDTLTKSQKSYFRLLHPGLVTPEN